VEYNKAPAVTRERMYLEAMQQVFTNVSKVMVDSKSNSNLLYLPLDKLVQQSAATAAPGAANPMMGSSGATSGSAQSSGAASSAPAAPAESVPSTPPASSLRDRLREAR